MASYPEFKLIIKLSDPPAMEIIKQINENKHFIIEQINESMALCKDVVVHFLKDEVTKRLEIAEYFILSSSANNANNTKDN